MSKISSNTNRYCIAVLLALAVLLLCHAPAWATFADNPLNSCMVSGY